MTTPWQSLRVYDARRRRVYGTNARRGLTRWRRGEWPGTVRDGDIRVIADPRTVDWTGWGDEEPRRGGRTQPESERDRASVLRRCPREAVAMLLVIAGYRGETWAQLLTRVAREESERQARA